MRESKIMLCSGIHLDKDHVNVLNYTENQMLSLCQSNALYTKNDYSFIRERGTIQTDCDYGIALQCNYLAFQNKDYSNKWFFAFIDDVKYLGEKNTEIVYTVDSFSTFFPSISVDKCYVVREHVNDDTIGKHTVNENLDVGDVVEVDEFESGNFSIETGFYVAILSSYDIADNSTGDEVLPSNRGKQFAGVTCYTGTIYGTMLYLFKITSANATQSIRNIRGFIGRTNYDGHPDDIEQMFIIPNELVDETQTTSHTAHWGSDDTDGFTWDTLPQTIGTKTLTITIPKLTSFTGLTIHNKKCFVYPYNYLYATNNQGNNNIYKYEDFSTTGCEFKNYACLSVGCSIKAVPKNYKGVPENDDEGLPFGKFPTCAWSSDAYTNWMTQNSINIATSVGMEAGSIASLGFGYGNMQSALPNMTASQASSAQASFRNNAISTSMSTSSAILNAIGAFHQASLLPNIRGGQAIGDVCFASDNNNITYRRMRAKDEYIKIIDSYFDRFRI